MNGLERELSRYQWGLDIAGASGATAIVAAALFVLYLVDHEAREDLGFRRDRAATLLRTADEIRETHAKLQRELPAAREQHRRLRQRIPREPQVAEFLTQLSALADDAGVAIRSFDPQTQVATERRIDVMVHLSIDGEYANICRFLWDVDRLPRLSRLRAMTLSAPDAQQSTCSLELDLLIFSWPEEDAGGPIVHTLGRHFETKILVGWQGQKRSDLPCDRQVGPSRWSDPGTPRTKIANCELGIANLQFAFRNLQFAMNQPGGRVRSEADGPAIAAQGLPVGHTPAPRIGDLRIAPTRGRL